MMFIQNQSKDDIEKYYKLLKIVGSLSKLFSESNIPYLYYRASENIFCKAFNAENLSRSDCSADARKEYDKKTIGIGIKTFIENKGNSFQKISEFNKSKKLYDQFISKPEQLIHQISLLRNKRIESTKVIHGINNMIYHCVTRSKNIFKIHEEEMQLIQIEKIKMIKSRGNNLIFNDSQNEYNFNVSKSTLYKRFNTDKTDFSINIQILDDPFNYLDLLYENQIKTNFNLFEQKYPKVILPLYSTRVPGIVPNKSGLNQWNAAGRQRDPNELYIPIPIWIHKNFPDFFPKKDNPFTLLLPNKVKISAKVCQEKSKALMSNPNSALGQWLLRDVLKIKEGVIVNYQMLMEIGIDSVEISKLDSENFAINFKKLGTFEKFKKNYN